MGDVLSSAYLSMCSIVGKALFDSKPSLADTNLNKFLLDKVCFCSTCWENVKNC